MAADQKEEVGFDFEEGRSWLPSHQVLLEEACDAKANFRPFHKHRHYAHRRFRLPAESLPPNSKTSPRPHQRPKIAQNWASGGTGMQAIFLDSGQKSCGTGVFLPQIRAGTNFPPSKKPGCAPVLLPSRVVQALNLNVHALGLQVSPRKDPKSNRKGGDCNSVKNKKGKDVPSPQCCVVSQNRNSSPELFLPKEWTY